MIKSNKRYRYDMIMLMSYIEIPYNIIINVFSWMLIVRLKFYKTDINLYLKGWSQTKTKVR